MVMKVYSCEVKDDVGYLGSEKSKKQRRHGEKSDAQDGRWKSAVREQISLCSYGAQAKLMISSNRDLTF